MLIGLEILRREKSIYFFLRHKSLFFIFYLPLNFRDLRFILELMVCKVDNRLLKTKIEETNRSVTIAAAAPNEIIGRLARKERDSPEPGLGL